MEALKMERPMDSWNDERLDELSRRMDEGFKEMREGFAQMVTREEMKELIASVNARFNRVENEMKDGFARIDQRFEQVDRRFEQVDRRFEQVDRRFEKLDERFERLYYTMITASFGLVASVILAAVFG
jgi:predicted RNase H-like nuclease (RuvC/YqgF family)